MKTTFYSKDYNYNLEINYELLFSKEWIKFFKKDFLSSDIMSKLFYSLQHLYNFQTTVYPLKKDIFKIFKLTEPSNNLIYMINCSPKFSEKSNGIAFGNKISFYNENHDVNLINIFNKINNYDLNKEKIADYSLESWVEQGVFLYNIGLTGNKSSSHTAKWWKFTTYFLNKISSHTSGGLFVLVGEKKHRDLVRNHLNINNITLIENDLLNYDLLNRINLQVDYLYGKNYRIKW